MKEEILFTPPLLASLLIAGLVMPSIALLFDLKALLLVAIIPPFPAFVVFFNSFWVFYCYPGIDLNSNRLF
jgi:hypothetical protein